MTQEQIVSLAVADAGLVNNPNICIAKLGTTFACVCEKCMKESLELMDKIFSEYGN